MTFSFSGGLVLASLVAITLATFPVKVASDLAGAKNSSLVRAGIAVALGIVLAVFAVNFVGTYITSPLAGALGFALAVRLVLGTSFIGAIGVMIVAFGISVLAFAALVKFGIIQTS